MPGNWAGSDRRSRLPPNWHAICDDVLDRDGHRCTVIMADEQRCPVTEGLQVDHVLRGDDHRKENLRTICEGHHNIKSSEEGNAARAEKVSAVHQKFRRRESHPGSLG